MPALPFPTTPQYSPVVDPDVQLAYQTREQRASGEITNQYNIPSTPTIPTTITPSSTGTGPTIESLNAYQAVRSGRSGGGGSSSSGTFTPSVGVTKQVTTSSSGVQSGTATVNSNITGVQQSQVAYKQLQSTMTYVPTSTEDQVRQYFSEQNKKAGYDIEPEDIIIVNNKGTLKESFYNPKTGSYTIPYTKEKVDLLTGKSVNEYAYPTFKPPVLKDIFGTPTNQEKFQGFLTDVKTKQQQYKFQEPNSFQGKFKGVLVAPFKVGQEVTSNNFAQRMFLTIPGELAEGGMIAVNPLNVAKTNIDLFDELIPQYKKYNPISLSFKDYEKSSLNIINPKYNYPTTYNPFIPQDVTRNENVDKFLLVGVVAATATFVPATIPFIETAGVYFTGKSVIKSIKDPTPENLGETFYSAAFYKTPAYLKEGYARVAGQYRPEIIVVKGYPKEARPATVERLNQGETISTLSASGLNQPLYSTQPAYAGTEGTTGFFATPQTTTVKIDTIKEPVPTFRTGDVFFKPGRNPAYVINQLKAMWKQDSISRGKTPDIKPLDIPDWRFKNPTAIISKQEVYVPSNTKGVKDFYQQVEMKSFSTDESIVTTIAPKTIRGKQKPEFEVFKAEFEVFNVAPKGSLEQYTYVKIGKTKTGAIVEERLPKSSTFFDIGRTIVNRRVESYKLQMVEKQIQAKELADWSKTKYNYIKQGSPLGDVIDNSGKMHTDLVKSYSNKLSKEYNIPIDENKAQAFADVHDIYKQPTYNYDASKVIGTAVKEGFLDDVSTVSKLTPTQKSELARVIRLDEKPPINIGNIIKRPGQTVKYSLSRVSNEEKVLINADRLARFGNKADPDMLFKLNKQVTYKVGEDVITTNVPEGKQDFIKVLDIKKGKQEIVKPVEYDYANVKQDYKSYIPESNTFNYKYSDTNINSYAIIKDTNYSPKQISILNYTPSNPDNTVVDVTYKIPVKTYTPITPRNPEYNYKPNQTINYGGNTNTQPTKYYHPNKPTNYKYVALVVPNDDNKQKKQFIKTKSEKLKYGKQKETKYVLPDLLSVSITEQESFRQKGFKGEQAISPKVTSNIKSLSFAERRGTSIGGYIPTEQLRTKRTRF